jgi:hypothetical protein
VSRSRLENLLGDTKGFHESKSMERLELTPSCMYWGICQYSKLSIRDTSDKDPDSNGEYPIRNSVEEETMRYYRLLGNKLKVRHVIKTPVTGRENKTLREKSDSKADKKS